MNGVQKLKKIHYLLGLVEILCLVLLLGCGVAKTQGEAMVLSGMQYESEDGRQIIVIQDFSRDSDSAVGIETYVNQFNEVNDTYFVVLEYGYEEGIGIEEYREKILEELKSGGGPDILNGDVIANPVELMEKRAFEDLGMCMAMNGLAEDDFEGETFDGCKHEDGIYGVNIRINMSQYSTFFVNGNSANKEGAWQFLSYLMNRMLKD